MKVKRFAGAAMAVLLTLSEPALAADMGKGAERIITTLQRKTARATRFHPLGGM